MAIVPPVSLGESVNTTIKRQPPEEVSSAIFGWGGFVNFIYPVGLGGVVLTTDNVFNVSGLGQTRNEYPTGAPADTHETYELGRIMASQIMIDCWMSRKPDTFNSDNNFNSHVNLLDAHDADEELSFAIGLGDQFVYTFLGKVKGFVIDASVETPVRLQLVLRPSGQLTRERVVK